MSKFISIHYIGGSEVARNTWWSGREEWRAYMEDALWGHLIDPKTGAIMESYVRPAQKSDWVVAVRLSPARSKARVNREHAKMRAMERYGIDLTPELIVTWERRIGDNGPDAVMLGDRPGNGDRVLYGLKHEGRWLPVIYDPATKCLVTLLPEDALDRYRTVLEPPPVPLSAPPSPGPMITGFVELSSAMKAHYEANKEYHALILGSLPPLPELPPSPLFEDYTAAIKAIDARIAAIPTLFASGHGSKRINRILNTELRELSVTRKGLKVRRSRVSPTPEKGDAP